MRTALRYAIAALAIVGLLAGPAFAQTELANEELGATVSMPDGWSEVEGNDRAAFNFKEEESHSQVEIIATPLMTPDVADVFFDTFHATLTSSEFTQTGREEKAYGDHSGLETIYSFSHSGVDLKVTVFQFVNDTTAWLVVSYVQADQFDAFAETFSTIVGSLAFAG